MPDHSNLKAKAEAATADALAEAFQSASREMIIDVCLKYALEYKKLQSELTALKAQVENALKFRADQLNEHERRAFNEGVEAAATYVMNEWEDLGDVAGQLRAFVVKEGGQHSIMDFAQAILHGDDEHKEWLLEAAAAFTSRLPLPPPRGKGTRPTKPTEAKDGSK